MKIVNKKINVLIFCLLLSLASCRTQRTIEVPVEIVKTQTEYVEKVKYDSIYIHDSIDRYTKGDTIFIYKEKTKFQYKYKYDTITKIDSIQYPKYITTVEEVNVLKWWQKMFMLIGLISIVVLLTKLFIKIKKLWI